MTSETSKSPYINGYFDLLKVNDHMTEWLKMATDFFFMLLALRYTVIFFGNRFVISAAAALPKTTLRCAFHRLTLIGIVQRCADW